MPRSVDDLSDRRFGHLIVLRRNGSDTNGSPIWECQCDCGNVASIRAAFLKKKKGQRYCSKQCRIYRNRLMNDLAGRRFGMLVAEEFLHMHPTKGNAVWRFRCDCGGATAVVSGNVISGNTTSCGCAGIASRIRHGKSHTRDYHNAAYRKWAKSEAARPIILAHMAKRRATVLQRTPKWLTKEHLAQIVAVYAEAQRLTAETGVKHHVDHVIPLMGKTVCGLHVPWNLRAIPQSENLKKRAQLLDDVC